MVWQVISFDGVNSQSIPWRILLTVLLMSLRGQLTAIEAATTFVRLPSKRILDIGMSKFILDIEMSKFTLDIERASMSMIDDISRQRYMPYCWNFGRGIFWFLGYVYCNRVIFDFLIRWKCIDGFSLTPSNKQLLNTQGYFNMIVMNCWILSHFCESKNQKKLDWEVDLNFDSIISSNFQLLTECLHW